MKFSASARRRARNLLDRAARPYTDQLAALIRSPLATSAIEPLDLECPSATVAVPTATMAVPSDWFHHINHELRTVELERLRGLGRRVVSVGANGSWYFDWFERCVGELEVHIGVEAFEPMPSDLPANVRWIPTTADRFDGIEDADIDIVFAGQTTEHLWADELEGFLLQAKRVLRPEGRLVLDSPNRLITQHLDWSHGGHTVELAADEITELLGLAGFEVESVRGIWRSRFGDGILELEEGVDQGATLVRRIAEGADHVDDCFIWWIVARPTGTAQPEALRQRTEQMFAELWPTRISRGFWPGPPSEGLDIESGGTRSITTLPFYLRSGQTRLTLELEAGSFDSLLNWHVDLFLPGRVPLRQLMPYDGVLDAGSVSWDIDLDEVAFAVVLELNIEQVLDSVRLRMPLDMRLVSVGRP